MNADIAMTAKEGSGQVRLASPHQFQQVDVAHADFGELSPVNGQHKRHARFGRLAPYARQIAGFEAAVRAAPFKVAPERNNELRDDIFDGEPWPLDFDTSLHPELNTFRALPNAKAIEVNYAALTSLWAVAKAAWLIAREGTAAKRAGVLALATGPGTAVFEARRLIDTARDLIGNAGARWPADLAPPVPDAAAGTEDLYANNVFLAATGWVVLHEIAHIAL